jgi:hypothetical protein
VLALMISVVLSTARVPAHTDTLGQTIMKIDIGGAGVAGGYWRQPSLTLYKTGDLACGVGRVLLCRPAVYCVDEDVTTLPSSTNVISFGENGVA